MSEITDIVELNITVEAGDGGQVVSTAPVVNGVACMDYSDGSLERVLGDGGWTVTYTPDGCLDE